METLHAAQDNSDLQVKHAVAERHGEEQRWRCGSNITHVHIAYSK